MKISHRQQKIGALVRDLAAWFAQNARDLPWRRTRDPYAIWVSEVMLQQTRVAAVIAYWERWMRALPNLAALSRASQHKIHKLWEGLGYYTRVRNMQKAARFIFHHHGGTFPKEFEDILTLPGIGRYTAGAICSIAFNQPKPILDGNVIRVLTRLFGVGGDPSAKSTNAKLWQLAEDLVLHAAKPRRSTRQATGPCSVLNQSLMELGALICTPRQPQCYICPVACHCAAFGQNRVAELPWRGLRQPATARRFFAFVAQRRGRFLVCQRPAGVVNAHLWEFPNVECKAQVRTRSAASQNSEATKKAQDQAAMKKVARYTLRIIPLKVERLCTIRHSITRYRISLEVLRVITNGAMKGSSPPGQWRTLSELKRLPFASAHKKILQQL